MTEDDIYNDADKDLHHHEVPKSESDAQVCSLKLDSPVAILMYRLPEDREELKDIFKAPDYGRALSHVWNKLRTKLKYEELPDEVYKHYDEVRNWFIEAAEDFEVDLY